MSSIVKKLFGGVDDSGQQLQVQQNKEFLEFIKQMGAQARGDAFALQPGVEQNPLRGYQAALDVYGQTIPQQLGAFQQGNMGAQSALLAGMPQFQNAIMGAPVDYSAFQPYQVNYDTSWAQQQLPEFISAKDLLGGGSGSFKGASGTAQDGSGQASGPNTAIRDQSNKYMGNPRAGSAVPNYRDYSKAPIPRGTSLNDAINQMYGTPLQGSDPNKWVQFLAEHGDQVGGIAGFLAGIPGGRFLGGKAMDAYWRNNQLQSPLSGQNLEGEDIPERETLNDALNRAIDNPNQSPGSGNLYMPWTRINNSSAWESSPDRQTRYNRSGQANPYGASSARHVLGGGGGTASVLAAAQNYW